MAVTAISDIIDPEVMSDQVSAKFPDMLVLGKTPMVVTSSQFPMGSPGTEFKIPFWKRVNGFGSLTEGVAMTPAKIQAAAEYATVQRAGAAYEVYDTAQLVSMADPTSEIASQIARRAAEYLDAALVTMLDKSPNSYDNTGNGAGTLTADALITGLVTKLGDNYQSMVGGGAIIMHSKPYSDLMKLGVIQNQYQSGMDVLRTGMIPTLLGMPVFVSDRVTTATVSSVLNYNTYIVGAESLGLFFQRDVKVEFDRDILLQADVIASTVHFAPHLFGYDSKTSAVVAEDNKSIPVVVVKSK
jgi:HK97 family phage major capsid protein